MGRIFLFLIFAFASGCGTQVRPGLVGVELKQVYPSGEKVYEAYKQTLGPWNHFKKEEPDFGSEESLKKVHYTLFYSYYPVDQFKRSAFYRDAGQRLREELWLRFRGNANFKGAATFLSNLRLINSNALNTVLFGFMTEEERANPPDASGMKHFEFYLKDLQKLPSSASIWNLRPVERARLINTFITGPVPFLRRMGNFVRQIYLQGIYSHRDLMPLAYERNLARERMTEERRESFAFPAFKRRINYDKERGEIDGKVDFIVVGAGPSGSMVAAELTRRGQSVVLLEKGPLVMPGKDDTIDHPLYMENMGGLTTEDGFINLRLPSAVGGGTLLGHDLAIPPNWSSIRQKFHRWQQEGKIPAEHWSDKLVDDVYQGVAGLFEPRILEIGEVDRNMELFEYGSGKLGEKPIRPLVMRPYDSSGRPPYAEKKTIVREMLITAIGDGYRPLQLIPFAEATKIVVAGSGRRRRVRGVEFIYRPWDKRMEYADPLQLELPKGKPIVIKARNVILCAGGMGSPALLIASDIAHPMVGKAPTLYPSLVVAGEFPEKVRAFQGKGPYAISGLGQEINLTPYWPKNYTSALLSIEHPYQSFLAHVQASNQAFIQVQIEAVGNEKDGLFADRSKKVRMRFSLSQEHKEKLREGIVKAASVLFSAGASHVRVPSHELLAGPQSGKFLKLDDVKRAVELIDFKSHTLSLFSPLVSSTLPMGMNVRDSVLTPDHEVWEHRGLYVVDSSSLPGAIGPYPDLTLYTLAKIFVNRLIDREKHFSIPFENL